MPFVKLSQGLFAEIDQQDFELVSKYNWCAKKDKNTYYATTKIKNPKTGRRTDLLMHRLIMQEFDINVHVDHEDGNGLRNIRTNIRRCTNSQNAMNRRQLTGTQSGFKGVTKGSKSAWIARITIDQTVHYLGSYKDINDAALAYNTKAKEIFGKFAKLNTI